ncbi:hypothetical protein CFP56_018804 [Quercus suber]|uniref:Uncharacterized protein n=1 Tax=Quercus suber TaxID=58331 RepID=A0AAW0KIQ6_QUESU
MNSACNINGNSNSSGKEEKSNPEESELSESLEHILPDSLFACPKKSADDNHTVLSTAPVEANENTSTLSSNNNQLLPSASPLTMATMKNVFFWAWNVANRVGEWPARGFQYASKDLRSNIQ